MIAAIHQPNYLPALSFFKKMAACDVFVLLDDAQFTRNSFINRNRINTPNGPLWLTVPVKQRFGQQIRDVEINNSQPWARKHWGSIEQNYQKAPHFRDHALALGALYLLNWDKLIDLNLELINYLTRCFGIAPRMVLASSLKMTTEGTERLIDICNKVGADTYLSGSGGRNYQDEQLFKESGITLTFQEGSFSNLSAIDDLLNPKREEMAKWMLRYEW